MLEKVKLELGASVLNTRNMTLPKLIDIKPELRERPHRTKGSELWSVASPMSGDSNLSDRTATLNPSLLASHGNTETHESTIPGSIDQLMSFSREAMGMVCLTDIGNRLATEPLNGQLLERSNDLPADEQTFAPGNCLQTGITSQEVDDNIASIEATSILRRRQELTKTNIGDKIQVRCSVCRAIITLGAFHEHIKYQCGNIQTLPKKNIATKKTTKIVCDIQKPHARVTTRTKKCPVCSKVIAATSFGNHMHIHTGEKHFQCEICGIKFIQGANLRTHMSRHSTEKPFQCYICFQNFRLKKILNSHMISHTDVRPYKCETCRKRFKTRAVLKRHSRVHRGEKPYTCPVCGLGFTQMNNMKTHSKRHTKDTEAPSTYRRCDSCDMVLANQKAVVLHKCRHQIRDTLSQ